MLLPVSTWQDIESWLKTSRTILIPIGSMEQHGPNGFVGTDALCPEIIAHHAEAQAPDDVLVGPTFSVGCAQHHLGFPGTITLRPTTMIAAMTDWTESLMRHGFERIYWLNGHGGNIATIQAAFSEIHSKRSFDPRGADNRPGLELKLRNWWDFSPVMKLCNQLYPVGHGSHATASEVSVIARLLLFAVGPSSVCRNLAETRRMFSSAESRKCLRPFFSRTVLTLRPRM